jgi:four helix bundle protein
MHEKDICQRTFQLSLRIIRLASSLPHIPVGTIIAHQIIRSGSSIGANVVEAQNAQSRKDFVHTMSIALKESRETSYWLSLIRESKIVTHDRLVNLCDEVEEITKIIATIIIKTKKGKG